MRAPEARSVVTARGKVHQTVSPAGLTRSFNHYLTHGSEFDLMVAQHFLGTDGKALLD
jgi:hypothetical protein